MALCLAGRLTTFFLFGLIAFVSVSRTNSQAVCPSNWVLFQQSCYRISSSKADWNSAKKACERLRSHLAVVTSSAKQSFLAAKMPGETWIGLYRNPRDRSKWLWIDGSTVSYTCWGNGEPNDLRGNEGCAHLSTYLQWKWNDLPCDRSAYFVCEKGAMCPRLSLGSGVRVSPSNCVSTNQDRGSKCVFSCVQGYRLSGHNSTQCGRGGAWSQQVNNVSCKAMCPKLSLGSGVRVSPSHCVSTNQDQGSKCVFSCAQGYRLSGHNSTQCGRAGTWSSQVNNVRCNAMCPKLSLGSGVRVSPSHCVSTNQDQGSKCVFSCAQGYRLSGHNSTQCGRAGTWSSQVNNVRCNDVNECSMKNGGCSHKCVNLPGSYRCECPDPELNLAADNKTCHANGVSVQCETKNMTITIPKSLLRGLDREHLRLLDTTCKAKETSSHFSLVAPLNGCNTTSRHTSNVIVYSNKVLEIPVTGEDVVTRVHEIEISFSCFYSKYGVVSSVSWKPSIRKLVFSDEGRGNFTMSLNMFPDNRFVSPYTNDDFPVAVLLRQRLFFEVSVASGDKQLSVAADYCYATPTRKVNNSLKYEFIKNGCPNDKSVRLHSVPESSAQRFSLEAFKFLADHPLVFVYCHVTVCNATNCAKKCPANSRGRRDVMDHMNSMHELVQGPIHLVREKREVEDEAMSNASGSSPARLFALSVICIASLVAMVMMAIKMSPDRPGSYKRLIGEHHEESH